MNNWLIAYSVVGLVAVMAGIVSTWVFRRLSWKFRFLDIPMKEGHKLHDNAIPLLGGAGMLTAWLSVLGLGVAIAYACKDCLPEPMSLEGLTSRLPLLGVIAGGAVALGVMGLVDDKKAMGWKLKLFLQAVICGIVVADSRIRMSFFIENVYVMWFVSLCLFLFIINAFNFFDNMDGLAAGVAFIASMVFAVVSGINGHHFVTVLGLTTAGVSLGYYFFNCYPASIFMGDCGSHFLGYMLAIQSALTTFWKPGTPTIAPLLIPCFVLALPIFDTFAVIYIRLRKGTPIFQGDHNHISHRFLRMGVSKRTAVLLVHLLTLTLSLGAITLLFLESWQVLLIFLQYATTLTLISILHKKNEERVNGNGKDAS